MNSQEKQPLLQNKILNPEEIKCKKYYLQDEILIPGKMNCQEKQPLLKEKEIIPEKELSHNRKWMSLVALLTISYLMIQAGAIMMYVINEYIHHRIKETMVTNTSSSLDTSSCSNINKSSEIYKNLTRVQQTAAQFVMYCNIAEYIPAFFSSLILSAYTDKYGRKFVIITCLVGYFLSRGLILWVIYTKQSLSFIVLAYVLEGCTGAFYTFFSSAFSAIADLFKDKKQRVLAVISIEFTSMLAISVSGVLSGVMVEDLGYTYTGVICVGLFSLPLILAIFLLPETLGKENRTNPDSIIGILKRPFEFYTSSTFKGKRLMFSVFVLAFGVAELSSLNRTSLETVYFLGTPFCWSPKKIGYFTSARHFGQGVIGLGSVKLMQKCWSNEFIAILSTVSGGASFIIEGLATTELMVYMVAVVAIFSFLTVPMIRGIMSTLTPADKQGSLFASLAAIQVLGSIVAVTTENSIYSATVSIFNGFVFLVMAGFCAIELVLMVFGTILKRRQGRSDQMTLIIADPVS